MPEDGIKSYLCVFIRASFILFLTLSRESLWILNSNRCFVLFHPKFKFQGFLARRHFVCKQTLATDLCCRATRWEGKNRWDRIGWRRNQGLPARHSPDGAAGHFRGLRSTNRGSWELERLEGSLSSGRGILSSKTAITIHNSSSFASTEPWDRGGNWRNDMQFPYHES